MVFTAKVRATNERISAFNFSNPIEILEKYPKGSLVSPFPDCDVNVSPVKRSNSRLHFRHWGKTEEIVTEYEYQPESAAHHAGKLLLCRAATKMIESWGGLDKFKVDVEIPINQGNIKRIADVAVLDHQQNVLSVYECQLSAISVSDLQKRVEDYEAVGIESYWYFGEAALTNQIAQYCLHKFGEILTLEIKNQGLVHTYPDEQ